jgi:urease accessory protein
MLLLPATSHAHLVTTGLGPVYDGISHFVLTPEDLIPALALALLAGLRGARTGRLVLFLLPAAWFIGGMIGLQYPTPGESALLTAFSFLALGALVAADASLQPGLVAGLAVAFGVAHGYLNGSAMSQAKLGVLGLAGIVASLFVMLSLVESLVVSLRAPWTRIAVRVAGSWIAAAGLLLLGWSLRPDVPAHQPKTSAIRQESIRSYRLPSQSL